MIEIGQGSFYVARVERTDSIEEGDEERTKLTVVTIGIIDGSETSLQTEGIFPVELQVQLGPHDFKMLKAGANVHLMVEVPK